MIGTSNLFMCKMSASNDNMSARRPNLLNKTIITSEYKTVDYYVALRANILEGQGINRHQNQPNTQLQCALFSSSCLRATRVIASKIRRPVGSVEVARAARDLSRRRCEYSRLRSSSDSEIRILSLTKPIGRQQLAS